MITTLEGECLRFREISINVNKLFSLLLCVYSISVVLAVLLLHVYMFVHFVVAIFMFMKKL